MEEVISMRKACKFLDVCETTLRRYEQKGVIRVIRLPFGERRYPVSEIDRIQGNGYKEPEIEIVEPIIEDKKNNYSIEANFRYVLTKYPTNKNINSIMKICKLVEKNTNYRFDDIIKKFSDLMDEGIIFNDGGTKKSRLMYVDEI